MQCCIYSTQCVPIMNGRRRGTREESLKQALDSAWSMEMSKLTRDGTAELVSRDQILRRERGQRIIHFPWSAADHEQYWQPCPVVRVIHTNIVLHTHTAVVTHIYIYIYAVEMVPNQVMGEMVLDGGRALYPCRYIWFTHKIFIISVSGST